MTTNIRVGLGYDVHPFVPSRPLWLGGIQVPHDLGLQGHSDADVLIHALCDALLGAAALGDIGQHFPDTDSRYRGIDSKVLLQCVVQLLAGHHFRPVNVDATICAQQPRLAPHVEAMRAALAPILGLPTSSVSIKATTTERLGFVGRSEGIAAYAVALIEQTKE